MNHDWHVITHQDSGLSCYQRKKTKNGVSTFFDDGGSFSRLDLSELPFKVRRSEHMHGETSHLNQNNAIPALSFTRVWFTVHHNSSTTDLLREHIRQRDRFHLLQITIDSDLQRSSEKSLVSGFLPLSIHELSVVR